MWIHVVPLWTPPFLNQAKGLQVFRALAGQIQIIQSKMRYWGI